MKQPRLPVQDFVAIVVVISASILTYQGSMTNTDYKELVVLILGYVFGRGVNTTT